MTTIGDLEPQLLLKIFSHLNATEAVTASLVQRLWKDSAYDELFWKARLLEDWCQCEPTTPTDTPASGYRHAYISWANCLGQRQYRPVMRPVVQAWTDIKTWLGKHAPVALHSLRPGVSQAELEEVEQQLGASLCPELAAIYRVQDGQALFWDANLDMNHNMPGAQQRLDEMKAARAARRAAKAAAASAAAASVADPSQRTSGTHVDTQQAQATHTIAAQHSMHGRQQVSSSGPDIDAADAADDGVSDGEGGELPLAGFHTSLYHGLFGGYAFYDHLAITRMLPLRRAVAWTQHLRARGALKYAPACLVVAASFNLRKYFIVDLACGNVYVNQPQSPHYIPAAPQKQEGEQAASAARAGVLGWLREYGRRLQAGWYHVENVDEDNDGCRAICLFPQVGPVMVEETTRGVHVTATSLFVPEVSTTHRMLFTYSIRFRLLCEEEQQAEIERAKLAAAMPAASVTTNTVDNNKVVQRCQLLSRHWLILDADGSHMDEVRGEGVIGKFPILTPGCKPFVYQSCTNQSGSLAYMEGDFRFVEGTMANRTGVEWDVRCPRFTLEVPEYIY